MVAYVADYIDIPASGGLVKDDFALAVGEAVLRDGDDKSFGGVFEALPAPFIYNPSVYAASQLNAASEADNA